MNDKYHEFVYGNLYIIAGFLAGLGVGIGICRTSGVASVSAHTSRPQSTQPRGIGQHLAIEACRS